MSILRKYATVGTVYFPLIGLGVVNFTSTASLTTADMKISKDGGAFATVGTAIANLGSYGYSYTFTTADLTAKNVVLAIISTAGTKVCEDTMILVETYGNASAQHPFDLATASVTVSGGTITSVTNSVTATVGTNNDKTGYSLSQTFPTNFSSLLIGTGGLVSVSTGAVVNVGTIDAAAITAIWAKAMVDPTAVPAITAPVLSALSWMFAFSRNVVTQTSAGIQSLYKSDGTTLVATATITDDGTTFTKGSFN